METFYEKDRPSGGFNPFNTKMTALAQQYSQPAEALEALYELSERLRKQFCEEIAPERIMTLIFGTIQFYKNLNVYEEPDVEAISQRIQNNDVRHAMFEIIMHAIFKHQYYHGGETTTELKEDLKDYMDELADCMNEPEVSLIQTTEGLEVHDNLEGWLKKIDD